MVNLSIKVTAPVFLEFGSRQQRNYSTQATNAAGVSLSPTANEKVELSFFDVNDRKVKISKKKNNGTWFDLTVHNLEKPATGGNIAINNSLQTNAAFPEKTDAKTMIEVILLLILPRILVLADTNKAMIPPLVTDPATNIKNPAPGMMVYDSAKNCSQYIMVLFGLIGDNLKSLKLKYF